MGQVCSEASRKKTDGEEDRQAGRLTDRQTGKTDGLVGRRADTQTGRPKDRQGRYAVKQADKTDTWRRRQARKQADRQTAGRPLTQELRMVHKPYRVTKWHVPLIHPARYLPGRPVVSGVGEVYQMFQSRGYCSKEVMMPWKLVSLSSSVMLSHALSDSQPVQGLSIWLSLSIT